MKSPATDGRASHAAVVGVFCAGVLLCGLLGGDARCATRAEDALAADILAAYRAAREYGALEIAYPLDGTVFPPEIVAPTFRWKDKHPGANTWLVTIEFKDRAGRVTSLTTRTRWRPSPQEWSAVKRRSRETQATVTVIGVARAAPKTVLSAARIQIGTSKDGVAAPLFYREVNLPFVEAVKDPSNIRWRFGAIDSPQQPPIVLAGLPVCGNCHSFSADGKILAMDVDYANDKGSYVIAPVTREIVLAKSRIITWSDYRREDGELTFGLLSQVSPDGRYAVSTVKDRSVFVATPGLMFSQLFFPIKGILAVHRRETGTFWALRGADDRKFVQSNPAWSPDGKCIVFARGKAATLKNVGRAKVLLTREECREFLRGGRTFLFDLYRIPFNDGRGGKPQPLAGASHNGTSNYFPKFSPDGKWIVFCKAKSFMLLQPDSELYIVPAQGGRARRLRCNTPRMNSWHSWSPNGKWLVFSSKANGPYTQLFLTHIDEQGRSSPPVLLENFSAADRAANIPEFVNCSPTAIRAIREQFLDDHSFVRAGNEFLKADENDRAAKAYRKALKLNPKNAEAHSNLGIILMKQAKLDEAKTHFLKAIEYQPDDARCHRNLGDLLVRQRKHPEAMARYREALRIAPKYTQVRINVGLLLLIAGRLSEAVAELTKAVELDPDNPAAHWHLGRALKRQGKLAEAVARYTRAVQLNANHVEALLDLATIRAAAQEPALRNGRQAVELATRACKLTQDKDARALDILAAAYAQSGRFAEAVRTAQKALQLARAAGNERLARRIHARLQLYLQSRPIPTGRGRS